MSRDSLYVSDITSWKLNTGIHRGRATGVPEFHRIHTLKVLQWISFVFTKVLQQAYYEHDFVYITNVFAVFFVCYEGEDLYYEEGDLYYEEQIHLYYGCTEMFIIQRNFFVRILGCGAPGTFNTARQS